MKKILLILSISIATGTLLQADDRPNVVFILSDDQSWGDYGFMGHPHLKTPHLDQLAGEGLLYERGYTTSSGPPIFRRLFAFDQGIALSGETLAEDHVAFRPVVVNRAHHLAIDLAIVEIVHIDPGAMRIFIRDFALGLPHRHA